MKYLLLLFALPIFGQKSVLDEYVATAFQQNITLQQKSIQVEKAMIALKTAQSLYQPSVAFQGGYQSGEGGRSIAFPVGDLLNPVYSTLNALTKSTAFPQIANVETNFFPRDFYDVKVQTTMPLYNKDISYNKQIQEQTLSLQREDVSLYKRELVKQIKTAYYNYLLSLGLVKVYENSLNLALEGKKVNEKLLANGKGLPAYLLRSDSEIATIQAQIAEAVKQNQSAQYYFNFLLNRELRAEIRIDFEVEKAIAGVYAVTPGVREELSLLSKSINIQETVLKMNESFYLPKLNGFVNLGSQATLNNISSKSGYYFFGLQMDIPIFSGKRNLYKVKQTQLDIASAKNALDLSTKQFNMATEIAQKNVQSSIVSFQASTKSYEAAAAYLRLIEKGYKEGVSTYLETVDARNQWMNAQINYQLKQFNVLIAAAAYEREAASYPL
ncbi:TolC family protein [Aquirufa antheringensis]|uniref:TolC family protein n=1 Tax=Aquirufa antheringensis TaxID=2516559 RepID=A0A4Q9BH05_9BACT|nr:TolC family protein [Aquirufa antheringensis]MCZ2485121.1 TolC family protein [Aquirufa antheringensis]TBH75424.1 TolC family protein [Aquirufa antheringensis]